MLFTFVHVGVVVSRIDGARACLLLAVALVQMSLSNIASNCIRICNIYIHG